MDAGSSGPPFNTCIFMYWLCSDMFSRVFVVFSVTQRLFRKVTAILVLLAAKRIGSDAASIALPLSLAHQFRPHPSFLSEVYLYQPLQL